MSQLIASSSTSAPARTATAGLRYVTSVDRTGPTSATRAKKITNATAVQITPSPTTAQVTSADGHAVGAYATPGTA